jgi:ribosomal RNA-processing protein 1
MASPDSPFLKQLAARDRHVRDKAVQNLRTYLAHRTTFSQLELLKLWKGLFYCMWLSDKPRTQQALARDLAGLVDVLPQETFVPYMEAFWETMRREWMGIDVLRMDKFLYLVRQYVRAGWGYFDRRGWRDEELLEAYLEVLGRIPLSARDAKVPDGMRYHMIDIWVDEMDKVDEKREGKMPMEKLLQLLRVVEKESPSKKIRERSREALEDERLRDWNGEGAGEERRMDVEGAEDEQLEDEDEEWGGIDD